MKEINSQLTLAIFLIGIILLCIMFFFYKNKSKNSYHNTSINKDMINKLESAEVISNPWDDAVDLIACINFKYPIDGDKLQSILFNDNYYQKVSINGMNADKKHCKLEARYTYHGLWFSIPLIIKNHNLSGMEYSHFLQYIQRTAIFVDGDLDIPTMQDTLTKAKNLKDLIDNASQFLHFKILLKEPTQTNKLIEWFYSNDKYKSLSSNQCAYYLDNQYIYSVEWPQQESTQVLYFYYTPALVDKNTNGLSIMFNEMDSLLQSWYAIVCTPDNQVLSYEMYEQINKNIELLYVNIESHKLKAGSDSMKNLLSGNKLNKFIVL